MPDLVLRIKRIVALASPDRDVRQRDLYLYIPEKAPRIPCGAVHIRNVANDVLRVDFPRGIGNSLEDSVGNRHAVHHALRSGCAGHYTGGAAPFPEYRGKGRAAERHDPGSQGLLSV